MLTRSSQARNGQGFFHLPAEAILHETLSLSEAEADIIICLGVAIVLGRGALMNEVRTHCSCPSRTAYPSSCLPKRPKGQATLKMHTQSENVSPKGPKREREREAKREKDARLGNPVDGSTAPR